MKNRNTLGRAEYVWNNLYWAFLLFLWYRNNLFFPVFGFDYKKSVFILAGLVILGIIAGILLTHNRRRNHVSILCNQILSYGSYFVLSLWAIDETMFVNTLIVALILTVAYSVLVISNYLTDRKRMFIENGFKKCVDACLMNGRTIVAYVLVTAILIFAVKPILGLPLMEKSEDYLFASEESHQDEGETIAGNMDTLLLLQEEEWKQLDASERLGVMKTVADIEANYLGIPEITVCTEVLEEDTLGHYVDNTRTVTLNLSYLAYADAYTMLLTICHECYHAYQYRLVDLYDELAPDHQELLLFYEASQYKEEFENYIDGSEDYLAYVNQWCESDSDDYAASAVIDYYSRIFLYIEENNMISAD